MTFGEDKNVASFANPARGPFLFRQSADKDGTYLRTLEARTKKQHDIEVRRQMETKVVQFRTKLS